MSAQSHCATPTVFPRSAKYDREFISENSSSGSNALWLVEWLCEKLPLRPNLRVLDLGCGDARSSVLMAKEFGVEVWAVDLHRDADLNHALVQRHGVADRVFPLAIDARHLPFPSAFFDIVVSVDAYYYFGSDDFYAKHIAKLIKPDGYLGLVGGGLHEEWPTLDAIPTHLKNWWIPDHWAIHSGPWWADHLRRSACYDIEASDVMPEGWRHWLLWQKWAYPHNTKEIDALQTDAGRNLGYWRVVGRRNDRSFNFTSWNPYGA